MFWYGWKTKTLAWDIGNGKHVVCVYRYEHLMFIIRWVSKKEWYLQGDKRSDDQVLTKEQVNEIFGGEIPKVSAWS